MHKAITNYNDMRKLEVSELNRIDKESFIESIKLPVTVILDNVRYMSCAELLRKICIIPCISYHMPRRNTRRKKGGFAVETAVFLDFRAE